jgi:hypothetical protein
VDVTATALPGAEVPPGPDVAPRDEGPSRAVTITLTAIRALVGIFVAVRGSDVVLGVIAGASFIAVTVGVAGDGSAGIANVRVSRDSPPCAGEAPDTEVYERPRHDSTAV